MHCCTKSPDAFMVEESEMMSSIIKAVVLWLLLLFYYEFKRTFREAFGGRSFSSMKGSLYGAVMHFFPIDRDPHRESFAAFNSYSH